MRNKIKEIMNKEEGFTLVELLAVIVILGIIVAIAIPAVGSVIDRANTDASDAEIELVKDAARLYYTAEEEVDDPVSVSTLITKGYLEGRSSETDELNKDATVTRVKNNDGVYTYTHSEETNDSE